MKTKTQYEALRESFYRGEKVELPETEFFDADVKELDTHFLYACGVRKIYADEVLTLHNDGWFDERFEFCHTPKLFRIEGQFVCTQIKVGGNVRADQAICEKVAFSSTPDTETLAAFIPVSLQKKFNDFYFEMVEKVDVYRTAAWYSPYQDHALWPMHFFAGKNEEWQAIFAGKEHFSEKLFKECSENCIEKMEVEIKSKNAQFAEWLHQLKTDFDVSETEWEKSWEECRFCFAPDRQGFEFNQKVLLKWLAKRRGVSSLT